MDSRAEQRWWRERFEEAFPQLVKPDDVSNYERITINGFDLEQVKDFFERELAAERERVMAAVEEVLMGNINAVTFAEDTKIFINLIRAKL